MSTAGRDQAISKREAHLQREIQREEARLAASQKRLASLRKVVRGDITDRVISIDAIWERRGSKVVGASVCVFQGKARFFFDVCNGPHELYGLALHHAHGWVIRQTGDIDGLTIRFPKMPDAETMRLLNDPGAWGSHWIAGGPQREDLITWFAFSVMSSKGLLRFRSGALPAPYAEELVDLAERAKRLPSGLDRLAEDETIAIINRPLRTANRPQHQEAHIA